MVFCKNWMQKPMLRLLAVTLRGKGSLFLGYPGAVLLIQAELVWVMSSAGGKPVLFLWQWCTPGNSAEVMTHRSVRDLEFALCTSGWFCVRNWRATWFIGSWVCEEICGVAESCAFSTGQTSDEKRACLLSLFPCLCRMSEVGEHGYSQVTDPLTPSTVLCQEPFQALEWCLQAQWGSTPHLYQEFTEVQVLKFAVQSFTSQAVLCNMRAAAVAAQTLIFRELMQNLLFYWKLENYFQCFVLKWPLSLFCLGLASLFTGLAAVLMLAAERSVFLS